MKFNSFYKKILNEQAEIFTPDQLANYDVLINNRVAVQNYYKLIRRAGWYKEGVKVLIPKVQPNNEVEAEAKRLVDSNPYGTIPNIKSLRQWSLDNPEIIKKHNYEISNSIYETDRRGILGLRVSKELIEKFMKGYVIFPKEFVKKETFNKIMETSQKYADQFDYSPYVFTSSNIVPASDVIKNLNFHGIKELEEYKEVYVKPEAENVFGGMLDEL